MAKNEKREEPVVVWEAPNQLEAQIVVGRLESEGIPAMIRGEAAGTVFGFASGNLAETEVLVPAALADKATELLESDVDLSENELLDESGHVMTGAPTAGNLPDSIESDDIESDDIESDDGTDEP